MCYGSQTLSILSCGRQGLQWGLLFGQPGLSQEKCHQGQNPQKHEWEETQMTTGGMQEDLCEQESWK